jgi:hypothetical protein
MVKDEPPWIDADLAQDLRECRGIQDKRGGVVCDNPLSVQQGRPDCRELSRVGELDGSVEEPGGTRESD